MNKRKIIKFAWAALAGVAALACTRETLEPAQEAESGSVRKVTFHALETKSKAQFGEKEGEAWPTLWTSNDTQVKLSLNYGSAIEADVTPSSDYRSATFGATIDFSGVSGPYTYYSVSPASVAKAMSPSREAWKVSIPSVQTPSAGSPDENALIIASTSLTYATVDDASDVDLYFQHLTAYGCISLTDLSLANDETVQAVEITSSGAPFVGDWYWRCGDAAYDEKLIDYGASSTLTINTSSTSAIWFGCAPVDMTDQLWVITVITNKGSHEQMIAFDSQENTKEYKLISGQVATFTVSMDGATFTEAGSSTGTGGGSGPFTLVTDASTLAVGDEVLIAYTSGSKALGESAGNYRNPENVSITNGTISDPGDATVLTIGSGSSSGSYSFFDGEHYLSSPESGTSNNLLSTATSVSAYSSWTISIDGNGLATIIAKSGARKYLRYNSNNPRFSCYLDDSIANTHTPSIYRRSGSSGGVSADDPMLQRTNYGCWLGTGLEWEYNPGTDQVTRSYDSLHKLTYTLVNPDDVEELEIGGYAKGLVKGDDCLVTINWRRGINTVHTGSYPMKVIKEDGPKVWISDGSGKGVIIKK